ncbi:MULTISPECIES: RecQ family ATP-dependent DNA helicase [Flectobacillus]|jgi:ATP-dependent DNA helicase RecQ|uniref:ATP-dependent DNA helicase RecQ n=1 Tax=Flectobacillus roseus TaxID=502259 RepID=A0ABT6YET3_9BACT|nr:MULTISPECIES: ATP-dependent DNA helicase RecQ [Flectobacillus]MDI9862065.1 ATP-dependent DNA helicase RecQ [Flectobacillus roseus]MDI9870464.1 ATP-dependent DNA helicase RecQ [Flectobacillus roseus]PAC31933.1 ATP-dependent DNA helicase RecQ [Flectobacillus sp. BAB-3569]
MSVSQETTDLLKEKLKETFGYSQFRGEQEDIIKNTLAGKNTFVIMPTGAGKSLCYQLPAIATEGTAIVISPLIALMKNQVDQMNAFGINAQFLNSSLNKAEMTKVKNDVISGQVKLLYIAPESLTKEDNLAFLKQAKISFVAIDEAHCISEWGHDFRPEYRRIRSIVESLDSTLPIIALTATATPKVQQDIQKNLNMDDATLFKSSFNRKNLYYEIRAKRDDIDKQIIKFIKVNHGKAGIIYCLSRKKVEEVAEVLNVNGIKALPYHAGLDSDIRMANQEAFLNEEAEVMVATIAFGMGIDKPDVRFVIHYDAPKSLEGYYQETGRAGRDGLEGICIMFYAKEDINKLDKFNKDKTINERDNARMLLNEMVSYSTLGVCRRRQLLHYFGEHVEKDCGYCDNCKKPTPKFKVEQEVVLALQAAIMTGERFDAQHLADVLLGHKNQYVTSYEHHKLDIFGKGKSYFKLQADDDEDEEDEEDEEVEYSDEEDEDGNPIPKPKAKKAPKTTKKKAQQQEPVEQWLSVIRQITVLGYLEKDIENYGILKVSEKGHAFLKDSFPLTLSKDHDYENEHIEEEDEKESLAGGGGSYDAALFELLKNLRKKIAKDKNLPPYVIFQDPSLEEMATTYPTTKEDMAQINGVGMGKVVKFGRPFIDLIKKYVEDNEIETATEVVVKSTVNKSKIKIHIIQQVDRKVDLDIIAEQKELAMEDLIEEIEHICYSGTKLNLDYYINQVVEPDKQDEIYDYFLHAETDNIAVALDKCGIDDITEEELRLMRIKFLSELAN